MKKKLVSLLCVLATVTAILAGCGSGTDTQQKTTSAGTDAVVAESKTEATEAAPASDVTLKVVAQNDGLIEKVAEAFTEKTGIKVEFTFIEGDNANYQQKVGIMMNGGTSFDVFYCVDGAQLPPLIDKGYVEPITSYIARDINTEDYSGKVEAFTYNDGEIYALPYRGDYYMVFYNKDLFDQYNVPYPTDDMTWDDFEQLTYQFPGKDENVYGAYLFNWPGMVYNWAWQTGEYDICSGVYDCLKPEYERFLRMQDAGSIIDYALLSSGSSDAAFQNGNIAMVINGTWGVAQCITAEKEGDIDFNWDVAHLPCHGESDKGNIIGSITPYAMHSGSEHKEEAWEFMTFVSGEESAMMYAENGWLPAMTTDAVTEAYASADGSPANLRNALDCNNFYWDKPAKFGVSEYKQILSDEHSLIMLKEETIDEGIANINKRAAEVEKYEK